MTPSPLLRYAATTAEAATPRPAATVGMTVAPFTAVAAWLAEIDRQAGVMRPRSPLYARFDQTARTLTVGRIRTCNDAEALTELVERLGAARWPGGHDLHGLDRVWSRAELGVLLTEAINRGRQLALGRVRPKWKGPRFDPRRLPKHRLEHLIQHHPDMAIVEMLRAERQRRDGTGGGDAS